MRLLIVDDNATNLKVLVALASRIEGVLAEGCADPVEALRRAAATQFDLLLVDYMMPVMDGIAFITELRRAENYASVPIVMVTADEDREIRLAAIAAGAIDFLTKPIDPVELKARVANLLSLRQAQLELAARAAWLAQEVEKATSEIAAREEEVIWRLARAMEFRDGGTGEHISRVARISQLIAQEMGLGTDRSHIIYLASPLHDVGKIGVADAVLGKPGRLSADEMTAMREHVRIGEKILSGGSSNLLRVAEVIASTHHERWDGTGYPRGLAGTDIPIEGRVAAVADVFDALCTERPYKPAWPLEVARAEIVASSATHFDPACVAAFERCWVKIRAVMEVHPASGLAAATETAA